MTDIIYENYISKLTEEQKSAIEELKEIGTYRRQLGQAMSLVRSVAGKDSEIAKGLANLDDYLGFDMNHTEAELGIFPHALRVCPKCYSEHIRDEVVKDVAGEVAVKNDFGEMEHIDKSVHGDGTVSICDDCGNIEECF